MDVIRELIFEFSPEADAEVQGQLEMIHNMTGFKDRMQTARRFLPEFGLGAFCGFGRMAPAEMPRILEEHLDAIRHARA